ncbi:hypothetical protein CQW23_28138 [Capsicum baccatum]|uniref:Ubiquitin-like protease family profile domain-containing protein n=1 Tax=Capsicum baccatum TaxID=33114 RepID=A0A2G2VFN4_CAPBA|nr:hypothetical protein CQW23_28138 [Capsicum baccatum]
MAAMFNGDDKVVFKNIEATQRKILKFDIPQQEGVVDEPSVDFDDDFIYSQVKKSLKQQTHKLVVDHTQKRTPSPRATKKINICFYYLRKKSKYEPHSTYKYNTVDCNFMNIVWTMIGVYSLDDPTLNAEGHEYHLNEYVNRFCMHVTVPWHTVDNIFIPVNVKDRDHWVLVVLSFSERYIFIYNSYEFSDHYAVVIVEIEKLAKIIPLCLKACNFYKNKDIDLDNHSRYKDKDMLDLFDVLFVDDLPQQPSESLSRGTRSRVSSVVQSQPAAVAIANASEFYVLSEYD